MEEMEAMKKDAEDLDKFLTTSPKCLCYCFLLTERKRRENLQ